MTGYKVRRQWGSGWSSLVIDYPIKGRTVEGLGCNPDALLDSREWIVLAYKIRKYDIAIEWDANLDYFKWMVNQVHSHTDEQGQLMRNIITFSDFRGYDEYAERTFWISYNDFGGLHKAYLKLWDLIDSSCNHWKYDCKAIKHTKEYSSDEILEEDVNARLNWIDLDFTKLERLCDDTKKS